MFRYYLTLGFRSLRRNPILTTLMVLTLSIISLGQRLTAGALVGAALSFAGVLVVVSNGSLKALLAHGLNLGDAMMLIATLAYAIYSTLLKKWQLRLPPLQMLYLQVLVAIVLLRCTWCRPKSAPTCTTLVWCCMRVCWRPCSHRWPG